ncbi:MAG: carbon storage regulator CsrA [Candidatus Gastranaerophilales bacterium]|nr:carbon storage regulator CsrA [Candidatus Gastranaerophilales bacterium]
MLVLTRKKGQKLIINNDIEIIILDARGDSVKVGVQAPKNVTIFREEIYEEIKKANEQSIKATIVSDIDQFLGIKGLKKDISQDYMNKIQSMTQKLKPEDNKNA